MKHYNVEKIMVNVGDVDLAALKKELGEGMSVEHTHDGETREATVYVSLSPDKSQYSITSGVVDETQIDGNTSARDLVQAIVDAHDKTAAMKSRYISDMVYMAQNKSNSETVAELSNYFETPDMIYSITDALCWLFKSLNVSSFRDAGLKVQHTSSSFQTVGEELTVYSDAPTNSVIHEADTDANISLYYNELIAERAIPFIKLRDSKLDAFFQEKENIENQ